MGRSGSSDGVEPELVVEDVSGAVVLGLLRVRVGRSGSSDGVVPVLLLVDVGVGRG